MFKLYFNNITKVIEVDWMSSQVNTDVGILYQLQEPFVCSLINKKITPASIVVTSVNNSDGGIDGVSLIDGGNGYIPDMNTIVNLSSQTKLGWTQHTLETLGVDKIEGICVGGFRGSSTETGYIIIQGTSH